MTIGLFVLSLFDIYFTKHVIIVEISSPRFSQICLCLKRRGRIRGEEVHGEEEERGEDGKKQTEERRESIKGEKLREEVRGEDREGVPE